MSKSRLKCERHRHARTQIHALICMHIDVLVDGLVWKSERKVNERNLV